MFSGSNYCNIQIFHTHNSVSDMPVPSQEHCGGGFQLSSFYPDIAICYTDYPF